VKRKVIERREGGKGIRRKTEDKRNEKKEEKVKCPNFTWP
jgi:hypothetical protein